MNLARWQLEALLVLAYGKAHWKTAGVSFHENFWLATSVAAPIITLAIVVAIPDAANMRFRAAGLCGRQRVSGGSPRSRAGRIGRAATAPVTGPASHCGPRGGRSR